MNRGSLVGSDWDLTFTPASMRPRFMNRGSQTCSVPSARKRSASMRPRFMNRGSCAERKGSRIGGIGFNEAPIHESGKWTTL